MKIQNSAKWCNLYLNESKYRLTTNGSQTALWLKRAAVVGLFLLVFYVTISIGLIELTSGILLTAIVWLTRTKTDSPSDTLFIELTMQGQLSINQQAFTLLPSSRIGWFGCWLVLNPQPETNTTKREVFIFKDSLNQQDYRRLCRWLLRFRFLSPAATK